MEGKVGQFLYGAINGLIEICFDQSPIRLLRPIDGLTGTQVYVGSRTERPLGRHLMDLWMGDDVLLFGWAGVWYA